MRLTAADDANADLPPAVRARIVALQDQSEKLIGWIQLVIVIAFGVLYGLSRQTAPMDTAIWLLTPAAIGALFPRHASSASSWPIASAWGSGCWRDRSRSTWRCSMA